MICMLFMSNSSLPETRTGVMQAIVDRSINRESIRAKGKKALDRTKEALYKLGKLAWEGLKQKRKKLIFEKVTMHEINHKSNCFIQERLPSNDVLSF